MTILSVVKDVCATVGVLTPQSMFTNITGNRTMQEMLALANETAQSVAYDNRDWTTLKTTVTYTGDGITAAYDLPANYKRMLLTSNVWRSWSTQTPMTFVPDLDEWLIRRADDWNTAHGEWTMYGGQIHFWPALEVGESAYFAYLDKNCVALNGGGVSDAFLSDTDGFRLDERVLKLGMIWKWKAQKGSPYAEDLSNYGDAVAMAQGHDSPSPIIVGRMPISASVRASYPLGDAMSQHQLFKRMPVNQQVAQKLESTTFPAPTRGLVLSENESFMQPGAAIVMDNWVPTMKGSKLRGGCIRWAELPETTPVISAFEYASGINHRMFAANATKIYNVTTTTPVLVAADRTSGNHVASQLANQGGDFMLVADDAGDPLLRYNGTTWASLATTTPAVWSVSTPYAVDARALDDTDNTRWKATSAHTSPASGTFAAARAATPGRWVVDMAPDSNSWITGPAGSQVENGGALTYVCKYRNRYFFIERNSMNAWYLPLNAVGGALAMIPLSGAATKGGRLLFCASWSIDAGDGIDDKLVFCTDLGELIIFTGSDPSSAANWRQEGRYEVSPPMGMNAHIGIGGDMLIATVDGIVPISGSISKDRSELELAAITRNIKPMWRLEVMEKREWAWTMCKWDEYGGLFVTWPGGIPGKRWCGAANLATGAWCRFVGYDATCFIKMRGDMFFGTQGGVIMQADRTGYDDGMPYTAILVGGWEVFQSPGQTITWRQARASFSARANEPFAPQLSATTDYVVVLPTPPSAGPDSGVLDLWDEGLWGTALWDAGIPPTPAVRNTGWVSIGRTGFSHAPVVQVTVAQQAKPEVDLISIAATFERAGVNV